MVLSNRVMPFLIAGIGTLVSCGDSHLTSNIAAPQPENPYVAIFQARCCDGDDYYSQTSLLYSVDRQGEITPLSDKPEPGTEIAGLTASPDGRYIAYWKLPRLEPAGAPRYRELVIASLGAGVDGGDLHIPVTTVGEVEVQIDWLPDSSGVVYTRGEYIRGEMGGVNSQLLLVKVNERLPRELVGPELGAGARLRSQVTADSRALAVLVERVDCLDDNFCAPKAGSLYFADLASGGDLSLLEPTTGLANSFDFQWSNDGNELIYQARQYGDFNWSELEFENSPAGPLKSMVRGQSTRTLLDNHAFPPGPLTPYLWLDDSRLLLNGSGGFEVISTEEQRLAQGAMDSKAVAVPSPDGNRIAYIASDTAGGLAVYVLDLRTGVSQALGPTEKTVFLAGGAPTLLHSDYYLSALKWSADGALLAWDRAIRLSTSSGYGPDHDYDYELYVHDFRASQTQRIAPRIEQERYERIAFSWLSGENLLEYIGIDGDKRVLILSDPVTRRSVLVGEFDGAARSYPRIWRSAAEVLWNSCEGIYLGELDAQGGVTNSKLLDVIITDPHQYPYQSKPHLDANREFAVMNTYNPTIAAYEWFLYDFEGKRIVKLDTEDGNRTERVILLESE